MNDHVSGVKLVEVTAALLPDLGTIPNNPRLPLLLYKQAVDLPSVGAPEFFETLFTANGWPAAWRNGIYGFHHYHSTAHEALGIFSGSVTVRLGGDSGVVLELTAGDVAVLPAGVCHQRLSPEGDLGVVGAYPSGQSPDRCLPDTGRLAGYLSAIGEVGLPACDPAFGATGPLVQHWPVPA